VDSPAVRVIDARPPDASGEFVQGILPFVHRRRIDPSVIHNLRDMQVRIEKERPQAGRGVDAELKEET
jgi:glutamine synthetase adenylyltransferase